MEFNVLGPPFAAGLDQLLSDDGLPAFKEIAAQETGGTGLPCTGTDCCYEDD